MNAPELAITDAHLRKAMLRAMRTVAGLAAALALVLLVAASWRSAVLLLVGAAIAGTGLWEWSRLLGLITARLEQRRGAGEVRIIVGFVVRLILAAAVLYASLKGLHGSVFALLGGLALAALAMTIEAIRLVRS